MPLSYQSKMRSKEMLRKVTSISFFVILTGCATSENFWKLPPGVSEQTFKQDEYACLQESQQQSSSASVNAYGGTAQSGSVTNYTLYQSCMQARGYVSVTKKSGAEAHPKVKKPFPDAFYEVRAREEITVKACVANSSISQEDLTLWHRVSDGFLSNHSVDQQKLNEARSSQRGYVASPQDCDKLLQYINQARHIDEKRGA